MTDNNEKQYKIIIITIISLFIISYVTTSSVISTISFVSGKELGTANNCLTNRSWTFFLLEPKFTIGQSHCFFIFLVYKILTFTYPNSNGFNKE